ncbi:MAG: hypothetical protein KGK11_05890 [Sphingomonadales bacterium]|nr:hypothetical protein [Sphingomonadales bacterium]
MTLLSRLLRPRRDDRAPVRPLWHRLVAIARDKAWYLEGGVEDSVTGRFDMVTLVLALVLLRMEVSETLRAPAALLTELFIEDMDGQLRQSGVGDLVVGKRIGRLMSVLGGRLGALREALAQADDAALETAIARNVRLREGTGAAALAAMLRAFAARLDSINEAALLEGAIAR